MCGGGASSATSAGVCAAAESPCEYSFLCEAVTLGVGRQRPAPRCVRVSATDSGCNQSPELAREHARGSARGSAGWQIRWREGRPVVMSVSGWLGGEVQGSGARRWVMVERGVGKVRECVSL